MATDVSLRILADIKQATESINKFTKDSQKSVDSISASFASLKTIAAAAIGAIAFHKIIDQAIESEAAINRMNVALQLSGDYSQKTSDNFQELATSIEKTANIQDEVTLGLIANAKAIGLTNQETEKLVKASVDVAAVLGTDVNTAFSELGRTLNGQVARGLQQRFPELKGLSIEALQNGEAVRILGDRYKGAAESLQNNFGGAVSGAKIGFGNIFEEVGKIITQSPQLISVIKTFGTFFNEVADIIKQNQSVFTSFVNSGINFMVNGFKLLLSAMKPVNEILGFIEKSITVVSAAAAIFVTQLKNIAQLKNPFTGNAEIEKGLSEELAKINKKTEERIPLLEKIEKASNKITDSIVNAKQVQIQIQKTEKTAHDARMAQLNEELKARRKIIDEQIKGITKSASASPSEFLVNRKDALSKLSDNKEASKADIALADKQGQTAALLGSVNTALSGPNGTLQLMQSFTATIADTIIPGLGGLASTILGVLAQGPEATAAFVNGIVDGIPIIIENIIKSIPVLIQAIVSKIPEIALSFANQMPVVATRFSIEFVKQIPAIVKGFVDEFAKQVKTVGGLLPSGGGGGGGLLGSITSGIGKIFKFAEGGIVPGSGFGDTVPSMLTPGELVIDRSSAKDLAGFLESQKQGAISADALDKLTTVLSKNGGSQTMQINLVIGEKQLADVILNLNRNGFRTA